MNKHSSGGKRGGSSFQNAGDFAKSVYGDANQQHAQSGSNVIAMNSAKGGRKGGNVVSEVAVPAVLLYANYKYSKGKVAYGRNRKFSLKRFKKNKFRRTSRRSQSRRKSYKRR